jgi:hypothetical protein
LYILSTEYYELNAEEGAYTKQLLQVRYLKKGEEDTT